MVIKVSQCRLCPVPLCPELFHIQFFLKNQAKIYAEPKIAIMVTNPATERTAIPERAAPLVHPRAS